MAATHPSVQLLINAIDAQNIPSAEQALLALGMPAARLDQARQTRMANFRSLPQQIILYILEHLELEIASFNDQIDDMLEVQQRLMVMLLGQRGSRNFAKQRSREMKKYQKQLIRILIGRFSNDSTRTFHLLFRSINVEEAQFFAWRNTAWRFVRSQMRTIGMTLACAKEFDELFRKSAQSFKTAFPRLSVITIRELGDVEHDRDIELPFQEAPHLAQLVRTYHYWHCHLPLYEQLNLYSNIREVQSTCLGPECAKVVVAHSNIRRVSFTPPILSLLNISPAKLQALYSASQSVVSHLDKIVLRFAGECDCTDYLKSFEAAKTPRLRHLDAYQCDFDPRKTLSSFHPIIPSLQRLRLVGINLRTLRGISALQQLRHFEFSYGDFAHDVDGITELSFCSKLTSVTLTGSCQRFCARRLVSTLLDLNMRGQLLQLVIMKDEDTPLSPLCVRNSDLQRLGIALPACRLQMLTIFDNETCCFSLGVLPILIASPCLRHVALPNGISRTIRHVGESLVRAGLYEKFGPLCEHDDK